MKTREFRIGNYIYAQDLITQVKSLSDGSINNWINPEVNHSPIPITEEWLIKFGFKQERLISWIIYAEDNSLSLYFDLVSHEVIYGKTKLKYVHQVQNLCFILLDIELTLNNDAPYLK